MGASSRSVLAATASRVRTSSARTARPAERLSSESDTNGVNVHWLSAPEEVEDEQDGHLSLTTGWTRERWIESLGSRRAAATISNSGASTAVDSFGETLLTRSKTLITFLPSGTEAPPCRALLNTELIDTFATGSFDLLPQQKVKPMVMPL